MEPKSLDDFLAEIDVLDPGLWDNELSKSIIGDWWAVVGCDGIIAYFGNETDANRFRLDKINRILNP